MEGVVCTDGNLCGFIRRVLLKRLNCKLRRLFTSFLPLSFFLSSLSLKTLSLNSQWGAGGVFVSFCSPETGVLSKTVNRMGVCVAQKFPSTLAPVPRLAWPGREVEGAQGPLARGEDPGHLFCGRGRVPFFSPPPGRLRTSAERGVSAGGGPRFVPTWRAAGRLPPSRSGRAARPARKPGPRARPSARAWAPACVPAPRGRGHCGRRAPGLRPARL